MSSDQRDTIFWFHDKSSYNANDDQPTMWKEDMTHVMQPKGRGAGLMVSDFIEEKDGYLAMSDSLYETIKQGDLSVPRAVRVIFEYGKTREHFMEQTKVAEAKYPPRALKNVWMFDHSLVYSISTQLQTRGKTAMHA